jgi:hypothetical protein
LGLKLREMINLAGLTEYKLTEEKVLELKPIIESILSKKYGKEIKILDLTIGEITVKSNMKNLL